LRVQFRGVINMNGCRSWRALERVFTRHGGSATNRSNAVRANEQPCIAQFAAREVVADLPFDSAFRSRA
jgi:hypothetical protein